MVFYPHVRIYRPGQGARYQKFWACRFSFRGERFGREKRDPEREKIFYRRGDFKPATVARWAQAWLETNFTKQRAKLDERLGREKREEYVKTVESTLPKNVKLEAGWKEGYELKIDELSEDELGILLDLVKSFKGVMA
jgi:hypothetical protein